MSLLASLSGVPFEHYYCYLLQKKLKFTLSTFKFVNISNLIMDDISDDELFFESAHLALRSNSDYHKLIRHLTVLCAQRIQIHKDIEVLANEQRAALEEPMLFIDSLETGSLNLPRRIEIAEVFLVCFKKNL